MNKIGIIFHPLNEAARDMAATLERHLADRGIDTWLCSAWEGDAAKARIEGTDLVLTVGGDGTILRAAQAIVPRDTAITGINLGNLGFMTELSVDEATSQLDPLLSGKGWIDERALLEADVTSAGDDPQHGTFYALNDIVIAHGAVARLIRVEVNIDGEPLTTFKADGVIVSTATGSTGYALAAGGPILHPRSQEMLLVPIAPHLSASYALALPPTSTVELRLVSRQPASLTVDGHITTPVGHESVITVWRSQRTARFLRIHADTSYYGSLESRLKGKQ